MADYFEEMDGYPHVIPRRAPLHQDYVPVDFARFGFPESFHEVVYTLQCKCGATPSSRTSRIAAIANAITSSPSGGSARPGRPRRIPLPS